MSMKNTKSASVLNFAEEFSAKREILHSYVNPSEMQETKEYLQKRNGGSVLSSGLQNSIQTDVSHYASSLEKACQELTGVVQNDGAPETLVGSLQSILRSPTASAINPDEVVGQLYTSNTINPDEVVGQLHTFYSQQGKSQQPTILDAAVTEKNSAASRLISVVTESKNSLPPPTPELKNSKIPDISASKQEVAAFDSAAKDYSESIPKIKLDESNEEQFSSLAKYLNDQKDLPALNKDNISEADYGVLSELAYARKYNNSDAYKIAAGREGLTIQEYCDSLIAANALSDTKMKDKDLAFLQALRNNERYNGLTMDHVDGLDIGNVNTQVVTVSNGDGHAFIGIQGTNGTVTDWMNDGAFAGSELTEEEEWINSRINKLLDNYDSFDITGHSQGGRNAISAAAFLDEKNAGKLRNVYSLDGPGYSSEFMEKYGHRFKAIEDKMYHIFPEESYVGHLLNFPGGHQIFVQTMGGGLWTHELCRWYLDESNSSQSYLPKEGGSPETPNIINSLIRDTTISASERMSPEALAEAVPLIFYYCSGSDSTQLDFGALPGNLIKFTTPGDAAILFSTVAILADETFDQIGELISEKLGPILTITKIALKIASVIPWPGAGVCAAIYQVIDKIELVLQVIDVVLEVVSYFATKYLEKVAAERKAARDSYLAANGKIEMNYATLDRVLELLRGANAALRLADSAADYMWNCFKKKKAESWKEVIEDVVETFWEIVTVAVSRSAAIKYATTIGIDLVYLRESPVCNKAIDAIPRIINSSQAIDTGAGLMPTDGEFTVSPGALGQHAASGRDEVNRLIENIQSAHAAVNETGSIWQADDYNFLKQKTDTGIDNIIQSLENIRTEYENVISIAESYSIFQNTTVQEFQNAAN